jgi:uroporphyrinogen III methyltransferase/synthase
VKGTVVLVGAGPGDPDLLTLRAAREIAGAEVLLYDALIDPVLLDMASPDCERIDVGKRGDGSRGVAQEAIAELMIEHARAGRRVVRLKGGDPFVFGRGGEEASALAEAGIPFEVVPGISSAVAVPAYAGIPVTDRRFASSVAIITGHRGKSPVDTRIPWEALAQSVETLVVLMGTAWLPDIADRLIRGGRDPQTPTAVIEQGTRPRQRVVTAPLREIAERARAAGLRAPTIIVVGEVAGLRAELSWFEKRPLFGRRILVTREAEQGRSFASLLRSRGAEPVHVPLLEFSLPADPGPLDRALEKLDRYDWIVFTSSNAARFVALRLERLGRGAADLGSARVACIGPPTERAARALGIPVHLVPGRGYLPEDLARAMGEKRGVTGARILFPRAREGREDLVEALAARGADVDTVEAYRTGCPEGAGEGVRRAVEAGLDVVTLMSPSAARHLSDLLGQGGLRDLASGTLFAAIGPTTSAALRGLGVEPEIVCAEPTGEAMVEALEQHYGR